MMIQFSNKIKFALISFATICLVHLTFSSSSFRVDPHHDGHSYLSAYLGIFGIYPPQTSNVYGIAGPFIESKILSIFSPSLIAYRYIALFLICLSALLIYKIISFKLNRTSSAIFALLWISANPTWVSAISGTSGHIQVVWPNLWIQTFILIALYILFSKENINSYERILLGVMIASLPFFRIQGIVSSILLIIIVLIKFKKKRSLFLFSLLATSGGWLTLVQFNGGINRYFKNIIMNPLTIDAYSPHRSVFAVLNFMLNLGKYYLVILIFLLILLLAISKFTDKSSVNKIRLQRFDPMIILALILFLLVIGNYNIWVDTLYRHTTTLLMDVSVPMSVIYLIYIFYKGFLNKTFSWSGNDSLLIILSTINLSNLVYQYPLPDLGHRWWSSAISVIFIAYISENRIKLKHLQRINLNLKYFFIPVSVATIFFSILQGLFFQQINTVSVTNDQDILYRMRYPITDSEVVLNLQKSNKVLIYLEENGIKINYFCRDGLYYLRNNGYSAYSKTGVNIFSYRYEVNDNEVNFYCNHEKEYFPKTDKYRKIIIGQLRTDIFLVNKSNTTLTDNILNVIKK
jgi:hypothetical protein